MKKFYSRELINKLVFVFSMLVLISSTSFLYAADFSFVSMADCRGDVNGINKPVLDKIVALAKDTNPAFVLFSGDVVIGNKDLKVFGNQVNAFAAALKPLTDICPVYNTYGNHECLSMAHQQILLDKLATPMTYDGKYKGHAYSFDYENSHFAAVASTFFGEKYMISDEQLKWLEDDLKKASKSEHIFVFSHVPAFPVGPHIGSALDKYKDQRDKFWNLLVKYKVDVYFCGHEHLYNSQLNKGVYQIITGTCGAPFEGSNAGNFFHYGRIDVSGADVKITITDINNKVRDIISYSKKVPAFMQMAE